MGKFHRFHQFHAQHAEVILTSHYSSHSLLIAWIFLWKHFATGPILPMARYISIVNYNDLTISNNNFNLPVTKNTLFSVDFNTVRVNNCASVKNRIGSHLHIFLQTNFASWGRPHSNG